MQWCSAMFLLISIVIGIAPHNIMQRVPKTASILHTCKPALHSWFVIVSLPYATPPAQRYHIAHHIISPANQVFHSTVVPVAKGSIKKNFFILPLLLPWLRQTRPSCSMHFCLRSMQPETPSCALCDLRAFAPPLIIAPVSLHLAQHKLHRWQRLFSGNFSQLCTTCSTNTTGQLHLRH